PCRMSDCDAPLRRSAVASAVSDLGRRGHPANCGGAEGRAVMTAQWWRRAILAVTIVAAQFGIFELALRTWGSSEAAPSFQGLFDGDPQLGYRLKPHARTRFVTAEFATDIAVNGAGFRDEQELGPKPANERRIL